MKRLLTDFDREVLLNTAIVRWSHRHSTVDQRNPYSARLFLWSPEQGETSKCTLTLYINLYGELSRKTRMGW